MWLNLSVFIQEMSVILRDEISIYQHLSIKAESGESFLSLPYQMGIKAKANHPEGIYQRGKGRFTHSWLQGLTN